MRIVLADVGLCVACRGCEYACAYEHNGSFERNASLMRVSFYPAARVAVSLTCMHCQEAWCLEVCPAGAISRDSDTGAVKIDASLCAGCKMCVLACPFGNIHFDHERGVAQKCDLCSGDPACVRSCTTGALRFVEPEDVAVTRRETLDAHLLRVLATQRTGAAE